MSSESEDIFLKPNAFVLSLTQEIQSNVFFYLLFPLLRSPEGLQEGLEVLKGWRATKIIQRLEHWSYK